jgi:hypothetical protein
MRKRLHEQVMDLATVEQDPEKLKKMDKLVEDPQGIEETGEELEQDYAQGQQPTPAENTVPVDENIGVAQALDQEIRKKMQEYKMTYTQAYSEVTRENRALAERYRQQYTN